MVAVVSEGVLDQNGKTTILVKMSHVSAPNDRRNANGQPFTRKMKTKRSTDSGLFLQRVFAHPEGFSEFSTFCDDIWAANHVSPSDAIVTHCCIYAGENPAAPKVKNVQNMRFVVTSH